MPRAPRLVFASLVVLACLLSLSVPAHATPIPGGLQEARGTVTHYQVIGAGSYFATGPRQWTVVCTSCDVFITFSRLADGITVQDASLTLTTPGAYELRGFTGTMVFAYNAPHDMTTLVLGHGEVDPQN